VSERLSPNRNVVYNIARSYEALGRFDEAYRYYAEYRDKETDSGERSALEARLTALAPRVALVRVTSEPGGASVYIDREDLGGRGETPVVLALPPGPHTVIWRKAGHEPTSRPVELRRGREAVAAATLAPIVGGVRVTATPAAEVRVDRSDGDTAPPDAVSPAALSLSPGRHSLELRAEGHRAERREIVVEPHGAATVDVTLDVLPAPSGAIAVGGSARGASVAIDGKVVGFVPTVVSVPAGDHRLLVTLEGHEPWQQRIRVEVDRQQFFEPELRLRDPEIVAATRQALRVGDAPASVSLVDRGELETFGYDTLALALRGVRGFYDSDDGNYRSVGVRGFSRPGDYTNRLLVLRDGHVWNDDIVGSGFVGRDFAPDLEDVQRIEVARGPGSSFYGQGAFFGVVNVVSLAPGDGPSIRAGGALLSDGGARGFARASFKPAPDAGVSLSASAYGSPGQTRYFDEFRDEPSQGVARDADGEDAEHAALRARAGDFSLDAAWNRRRREVPTASFGTVFDPAHTGAQVVEETLDQRAYVEGRFQRDLGGARLLLRVGLDHADYRGHYPYSEAGRGDFTLIDEGVGSSLGGEAQVAVSLPLQTLTLGAEGGLHRIRLAYDDGRNRVDDERDLTAASVYAVDELVLSPEVRVTAGARLDRLPVGGDLVLSPRLAGVFRPYRAGRTKVVLGRAFRAPSFYEQYYSDGGVTQNPAPPLSAETIDTAEVEHTHELGRGAFVTASLFGSRIQHLIGLETDATTGLLVYRNDEDPVWAAGVELEARAAWASGAWVSAAVSVTGLFGGADSARTNSLPVAAALKALVPVGTSADLALELVYDAPRRRRDGGRTEHALLGSVTGSGRLPVAGLRWQVAVQNVLDWRYTAPVGDELRQQAIAQDGRRFVAGLSYEF
jgi:outer membrane receptor protein involved in Fe transport